MITEFEFSMLQEIASGEEVRKVFRDVPSEQIGVFLEKFDSKGNLSTALDYYNEAQYLTVEDAWEKQGMMGQGSLFEKRFREHAKSIVDSQPETIDIYIGKKFVFKDSETVYIYLGTQYYGSLYLIYKDLSENPYIKALDDTVQIERTWNDPAKVWP